MTTGQLVGVFDEPLLLHVHQDLLPADGTHEVRQAPAGEPSVTVELKASRDKEEP